MPRDADLLRRCEKWCQKSRRIRMVIFNRAVSLVWRGGNQTGIVTEVCVEPGCKIFKNFRDDGKI